jgi:hypothetical protein
MRAAELVIPLISVGVCKARSPEKLGRLDTLQLSLHVLNCFAAATQGGCACKEYTNTCMHTSTRQQLMLLRWPCQHRSYAAPQQRSTHCVQYTHQRYSKALLHVVAQSCQLRSSR